MEMDVFLLDLQIISTYGTVPITCSGPQGPYVWRGDDHFDYHGMTFYIVLRPRSTINGDLGFCSRHILPCVCMTSLVPCLLFAECSSPLLAALVVKLRTITRLGSCFNPLFSL